MPKAELETRHGGVDFAALMKRDNTLPSIFDGPPPEVEDDGGSTPYGVYINPKSKNWAQVAVTLPGLQEPDVVLFRAKPELPEKLSPLRFCVVTGWQYWCVEDDKGNILQASLVKDRSMKECVECVILAFTSRGVEACRFNFKRTKAEPGRLALKALEQAAQPEWADVSPAHKATLAAPKPFLRFTVSSSCTQRTARSSGYTYWHAAGQVLPATPQDWAALKQYFSVEGWREELAAIEQEHAERVALVKSKVK